MMMKSGAAMPAAVNRITAAISPATVKRESRAPVFGPVDAPAGAEQEFEQVFHDTPACEMHRRAGAGMCRSEADRGSRQTGRSDCISMPVKTTFSDRCGKSEGCFAEYALDIKAKHSGGISAGNLS